MYFIVGVLLIVLGLVMLVLPKSYYHIVESWKNNGKEEPSTFFLFSTRFGGVMFCLVGVLAIAIFFL